MAIGELTTPNWWGTYGNEEGIKALSEKLTYVEDHINTLSESDLEIVASNLADIPELEEVGERIEALKTRVFNQLSTLHVPETEPSKFEVFEEIKGESDDPRAEEMRTLIANLEARKVPAERILDIVYGAYHGVDADDVEYCLNNGLSIEGIIGVAKIGGDPTSLVTSDVSSDEEEA